MMKDILKNLGLLLIVVGVVILSLTVLRETQTNGKLVTSMVLVIVGFFGHIILNKYID